MGTWPMEEKQKKRYLTVDEAASKLQVTSRHILQWIKEKKFRVKNINSSTLLIDAESFWEFGRKMPPEWREAFGEIMMEGLKSVFPRVQQDVNEGFRRGIRLQLTKVKEIIAFLQKLHSKYEKDFDLLEDKSGKIASIITYARVIALLNSIVEDIEKENYTAATITFRPLFEAIYLTEYFSLATDDQAEQPRIKAWFTKNAVIMNKDIRGFLVTKFKSMVPEFDGDEYRKLLEQLFEMYSKPIHHTYRSIVETYKGYSIDGFVGKHSHRIGFDYSNATNMRDFVPVFILLESLTSNALQAFIVSFGFFNMTDEERSKLRVYKRYLEEKEDERNPPST